MKRYSAFIIIELLTAAVLSAASAQKPIDAGAAQWAGPALPKITDGFVLKDWGTANPLISTAIGPLTGFYRYTQLQGHLVQNGLELFEVPDFWLTNSDFPYMKKNSEKEVFFVDEFSITRFLGGYSQNWKHGGTQEKTNDMAYVDGAGKVQYRLELVKNRLQPYIDNGYTRFIIGIENVPWDLSRTPDMSGPYGVTEPPRDWNEWYDFIKAVCEEMKRVYPDEVCRNLKFKIGNEYNQPKSFTGSHEDYLKLYDWSSAAIHSVFPDAPVMPGEIGGGASGPENSVDYPQLFQHFIDGTNYAGLPHPSPVSVLTRSSHSFPHMRDLSPLERTEFSSSSMEEVLTGKPTEFVKALSLEYHQFGVLGSSFSDGVHAPGARIASWQFQVLFRSKASGYMDKCWSWNKSENVQFDRNTGTHFLNGLGWLYSVLDHLQGDQTWLLGVFQPGDAMRDITAVEFVRDNRVTLIFASWAHNPDETNAVPVRVGIPRMTLPFDLEKAQVRGLSFTDAENVFTEIRDDLKLSGNLQEIFKENPRALGTLRNMSANYADGRRMILNNMDKYIRIQQESLQLRPVPSGKVSFHAPVRVAHIDLMVNIQPDEVFVLVFEKK